MCAYYRIQGGYFVAENGIKCWYQSFLVYKSNFAQFWIDIFPLDVMFKKINNKITLCQNKDNNKVSGRK